MEDNYTKREAIQTSMEELNPTAEQSERMWQRLSQAMEYNQTLDGVQTPVITKLKKKRTPMYRMMQVAATIAVMVGLVAAANGITGGEVYAAIKDFLNIRQTRQDVAGNIADIQLRNLQIYAPEIYGCDGGTMVFGTIRGLIIYDMEQNKIAATVDTQKIDCVYFDSDSKRTCVILDGDELVVFNMTEGEVEGNYYVYDLSKVNGSELEVSYEGTDAEKLRGYAKAWSVQESNYEDTFDLFCEHPQVGPIVTLHKDTQSMYSGRSFVWTNEEGKENGCFLVVENGIYYTYLFDRQKQEVESTVMNLEEMITDNETSSGETAGQVLPDVLPEYVYRGDRLSVKAIWEYNRDMVYAMYGDANDGQVFIPGYVIYKEIKAEDELLVFGNFWVYGFQLSGTVLEVSSGGEMPACFHLKETADGYEVTGVDVTGDGAQYDTGIREFTKDYPEVYEMFFANDPDARKDNMVQYVAEYVKGNNLNIEYVKEFGWDPIPLDLEE